MTADIKSARRVLEIFEYFAARRSPASVMEVAKTLGYPQSSTSVLLHALVDLGYLDHDRRQRLYAPNVRLALVANGTQGRSVGEPSVSKVMEQLHRETGEMVILGIQNGPFVQYAYILDSENHAIRWHLRIGTLRPMTHAALGQVLLAAKSEAESRLIVRRLNAEVEPPLRVDPIAFAKKLQRVQRQGYAASEGTLTPGAIVYAMMLPPAGSAISMAAPIAVGVGGPAERLRPRHEEILDAMRRTIAASTAALDSPADAAVPQRPATRRRGTSRRPAPK